MTVRTVAGTRHSLWVTPPPHVHVCVCVLHALTYERRIAPGNKELKPRFTAEETEAQIKPFATMQLAEWVSKKFVNLIFQAGVILPKSCQGQPLFKITEWFHFQDENKSEGVSRVCRAARAWPRLTSPPRQLSLGLASTSAPCPLAFLLTSARPHDPESSSLSVSSARSLIYYSVKKKPLSPRRAIRPRGERGARSLKERVWAGYSPLALFEGPSCREPPAQLRSVVLLCRVGEGPVPSVPVACKTFLSKCLSHRM